MSTFINKARTFLKDVGVRFHGHKTNQVAAGADLLDVNVGVPGLDDVAMLPKVVQMLAENFDLPLCLDTPNALAIHAGVTCAITDPMKYGLFIKSTDLLLGHDNYAARYIKYFKAHPKEEPKKPAWKKGFV